MSALYAAAAGLGWLGSARAAFVLLTWHDWPKLKKPRCGLGTTWHAHHDGCYERDLSASRGARILLALVAGPAVVAGMVAWCWLYGALCAVTWAVSAKQVRTAAEIDADDAAVRARRQELMQAASAEVVQDLAEQTGNVPHYSVYDEHGRMAGGWSE